MEYSEYIKGCEKGDRSSQKAFYDAYARMVLQTARNYISEKDAAMDVVHDTFIKLFRKFRAIDDQRAMESYIRTVTINTAIDELRKLKRLHYLAEQAEGLEEKTWNEPSHVAVNEILNSISTLPEGARCILNLYAIEGYSHREIAKMMNISEGTSKSQLFRARKLLEIIFNSTQRK